MTDLAPTAGPYGVVFVPVPEAIEGDVRNLVTALMLARALQPWDEPTVASLLDRLDDDQRAFLLFVARARSHGGTVTDADVAQATDLTVLTARAIVWELVGIAGELRRAMLVLPRRRPGPGRRRDVWEFVISEPDAQLILRTAGGER